MHFRVMTYNIHKAIGGIDRRYRPQRIATVVSHYQPDLLLLQEVDDGVPRSRFHRQVDWLGTCLDYPHRAFQRNVRLRRGHYGNAILSRFPLSDVASLDLTVAPKKRRRALFARVQVRAKGKRRTVLVSTMHLGLAGLERGIQFRRLLQWRPIMRARSRTPFVVAGDFNDVWGRQAQKFLEPVGFRRASGQAKTFPALRPLRPLDGIYFRGAIDLVHGFASHLKLARDASDHLPLIAEFQLR